MAAVSIRLNQLLTVPEGSAPKTLQDLDARLTKEEENEQEEGGGDGGLLPERTCMLLLSSDSSSAVASSAAFVSVDESRCTIILAAAPKGDIGGCVCVGDTERLPHNTPTRVHRSSNANASAGF